MFSWKLHILCCSLIDFKLWTIQHIWRRCDDIVNWCLALDRCWRKRTRGSPLSMASALLMDTLRRLVTSRLSRQVCSEVVVITQNRACWSVVLCLKMSSSTAASKKSVCVCFCLSFLSVSFYLCHSVSLSLISCLIRERFLKSGQSHSLCLFIRKET